MNGSQIREARKRLGLSQGRLARLAGITSGWLVQIEKGRVPVPQSIVTIVTLLPYAPLGVIEGIQGAA